MNSFPFFFFQPLTSFFLSLWILSNRGRLRFDQSFRRGLIIFVSFPFKGNDENEFARKAMRDFSFFLLTSPSD